MSSVRKVILDSDDESSDIDEQQSNHEPAAKRVQRNADDSPFQAIEEFPAGTRSTSSSEKLRRELQNAHSNLFDPTPSAKQSKEDNEAISTSRKGRSSKLAEEADSPLQRMMPATKVDGGRTSRSKAGKVNKETVETTQHEKNVWDVPGSTPPFTTSASQNTPSQNSMGSRSQAVDTQPSKRRKIVTQDDKDNKPMQPVDESSEVEQARAALESPNEPVIFISESTASHDLRNSNNTPRKTYRKQLDSDADELGSDEIDIGLPREKYVPKPTRSRGAREVEHNSQPALGEKEEELPRKRKRRRASDNYSIENKGRLVEMGFRSSQATKALGEAEGDVEKAIDILFNTDTTPGLGLQIKSNEDPTEATDIPSAKNCQLDHEVIAEPEHLGKNTTDATTNESSTESRPKKKGRGRPRKSEAVQQHDEAAGAGKVQGLAEVFSNTIESEKAPLSEIQANQKLREDDSNMEAGTDTTDAAREEDIAPIQMDQKPPEETKATGKTKSEPRSQDTPAGKGKVPLKVGLSRRAPVEPLLRIIRK